MWSYHRRGPSGTVHGNQGMILLTPYHGWVDVAVSAPCLVCGDALHVHAPRHVAYWQWCSSRHFFLCVAIRPRMCQPGAPLSYGSPLSIWINAHSKSITLWWVNLEEQAIPMMNWRRNIWASNYVDIYLSKYSVEGYILSPD